MPKQVLACTVNGEPVEVLVQPYHTLLDALRDTLDLTGAKEGCGTGDCGACTVHVDGKPVCSCLMLALQVRGREVRTIEGLGARDGLAPLQDAFVKHGVPQCGFCIPGVIMSASALLAETPAPTEEEIRYGIAGNLCRCTGYTKMVAAIQEASGQAGDPVGVEAPIEPAGDRGPTQAATEPEATGQVVSGRDPRKER